MFVCHSGSGWSSGTISTPKECAGLSAHTCSECAALPGGPAAANKCRDCIRKKGVTGAKEVTLGDHAYIWCKGPNGKFEQSMADTSTRLSEFGCLYGLERMQAPDLLKSKTCEPRPDGAGGESN
jgi:hypothetical protein